MPRMDPTAHAAQLEALRRRRAAPPRDPRLAPGFAAAAKELARTQKRLAGAARAWEAVCPPALINRTAIENLTRGVLTIRARDAATRFELDRALRAGGEDALIRLAPTTIRRVKLAIGPVSAPRAARRIKAAPAPDPPPQDSNFARRFS